MTATTPPAHDVTDLGLAAEGVRRIEWAEREMPVLRLIRERFERERPLDGLRIGACLHVTTETANLMRTLKAGGAEVVLAASNPLSTKDDVAAALVAEYGIATFARRGEDRDTYYAHLNAVADTHPQITMDDGCDLVSLLHSERPAQVERGPRRHRGDDDRRHPPQGDGRRRRPRLPGRGRQRGPDQAPLRQPLRHRPVHARRHPAGDEHPHRRAQGRRRRLRLGGQGHRVADGRPRRPRRGRRGRSGPRPRGAHGRLRGHDPRPRRPRWGELFVTATGNVNVFRREHFEAMRDGAIMANSGHFDAELDLAALRDLAEGHVREVRDNVQEFDLGGKKLHLIAEGRLVNLGAAEGHPAAVMDMSFANQALSAEYVAQHHAELEATGLRRARGHRRRGRAPQAGRAGHRARADDRRTGRVRRPPGSTAPDPRMTEPAVAPYGSWRSPIRIDDLIGDSVRLAEPRLDGDDVYWLEGRPAEAGRRVARPRGRRRCRRGPDARPVSTSGPASTSTAAGAYVVAGGVVVFSDFADGRLIASIPGTTAPVPITPAGPWRYADLRFDAARRRFLAVREDHSRDGEAVNEIVDVPLDGDRDPRVLVTRAGLRLVAAALAGRIAARLARVGPPGHAVGRDPPARRRRSRPTAPWASPRSRPAARRVDRPARMGARRHAPSRLGSERLVEPVPARRRPAARAAGADGGGVRRPELDLRPVGLRVPAGRLDRRGRPPGRPGPPDPHRARATSSARSRAPFTEFEGLQVGPGGVVALAGAPGSATVVVRLDPETLAPAGVLRRSSSLDPRPGQHLVPRVDRVPDERRPHGPCALLPAAQPGVRRARRTSGRRCVMSVHGGPTANAVTAPEPRHPVPHQPRRRGRGRGLRRQHRLRPRGTAASSTARGASSTSTTASPPRTSLVERGDVGPGTDGDRGRQRRRLHDPRRAGLPRPVRGRDQRLRRRRPRAARPRDPQVRVALHSTAWSARIRRCVERYRQPLARSTPSTGSLPRCSSSRGWTTASSPPAQAEAIVAALAANGIPHALPRVRGRGPRVPRRDRDPPFARGRAVVPRPGLRLRAGRPDRAGDPAGLDAWRARRAADHGFRPGPTGPSDHGRPDRDRARHAPARRRDAASATSPGGSASPTRSCSCSAASCSGWSSRGCPMPRPSSCRPRSCSCSSCRRSCSAPATTRRSGTSGRTSGPSACSPSGWCCSRRSWSRS